MFQDDEGDKYRETEFTKLHTGKHGEFGLCMELFCDASTVLEVISVTIMIVQAVHNKQSADYNKRQVMIPWVILWLQLC